jgi:hypothetical protein
MATPKTVHSHSYQHFEDLQLSALDFYQSLGRSIKERDYPGLAFNIIKIPEGGLLSSRRKYLCISWNELEYLVCAAPFGRSFFISWWFNESGDWLQRFLRRIPLLGRLFREGPKSLYRIDTELIFAKSIDALVQEAVNKIKESKGYTSDKLELA